MDNIFLKRFRYEIPFLSRFAFVGIVASAIHVVCAWLFLEKYNIPVLWANFYSFLIAFLFSFSGHYFFTFLVKKNWLSVIVKFFLISFTAFFINNTTLIYILSLNLINEFFSIMISMLVIPLATYVLSRFWVFN